MEQAVQEIVTKNPEARYYASYYQEDLQTAGTACFGDFYFTFYFMVLLCHKILKARLKCVRMIPSRGF